MIVVAYSGLGMATTYRAEVDERRLEDSLVGYVGRTYVSRQQLLPWRDSITTVASGRLREDLSRLLDNLLAEVLLDPEGRKELADLVASKVEELLRRRRELLGNVG